MGTWNENLQPASFAGVEFPLAGREIGGGRASARHRPVFADGQSTEDTGREPYLFELRIPLFHTIDPNHYPTLKEQLRAAFDDPDTKGVGEYVDPELGPIRCKVVKHTWRSDAMERDGGWYTVALEEDSDAAYHYATSTAAVEPTATPNQAADEADAELGELGLTDAEIKAAWEAGDAPASAGFAPEAGATFATVTADLMDGISTGIATADEVQAQVDRVRRQIDATLALEAVAGPDGWAAQGALYDLADAIERAAQRALRSGPPVVLWTPPAELSTAEIAVRLYGDARRAAEVEARNPSYHPLFLPAGRALRVLAR